MNFYELYTSSHTRKLKENLKNGILDSEFQLVKFKIEKSTKVIAIKFLSKIYFRARQAAQQNSNENGKEEERKQPNEHNGQENANTNE